MRRHVQAVGKGLLDPPKRLGRIRRRLSADAGFREWCEAIEAHLYRRTLLPIARS